MLSKTSNYLAILAFWTLGPALAFAQVSSDFAAQPPLVGNAVEPNVMLVMSNDHELYRKAYNDYSDLDEDGDLETTYEDSITYAGYFDSNFCYAYDLTDLRFEPSVDISGSIDANGHRCDTAGAGLWSGNFLNWATMTHMDNVRNFLYGGYRVTDTATSGGSDGVTVLERTFLPEDAHSFVKVFTGLTQRYTPYTQSSISLCNTTYGSSSSAPLMRIAYGDWPQWSNTETVQCHYQSEENSGLNDQPDTGDRPSNYQPVVRVQVCVDGLDAGSSRCKAYTDSSTSDITYKPFGLLQDYGDAGNVYFGLMTGSYGNNTSGGVLRKDILPLTGNVSSSDDEIDLDNGTFLNQGASDGGIINTINRFRIVNWDYTNNRYDDCQASLIDISTFKAAATSVTECVNWGNPLSEIYLEALLYFSGDEVSNAVDGGGDPTNNFDTNDSSFIPSLPQLSWNDPLDTDNACATCAIVVISGGIGTFDKDEFPTIGYIWEDVGTSRLSAADLDELVDDVGDLEEISTNYYLVGNNGVTNNDMCSAKLIGDLSDVEGLCPEHPDLEGGFDMAGLAFHAQGNDLRDTLDGVQSVNTYSVGLTESTGSLSLTVNGNTVNLVPTCYAYATAATKVNDSGWERCSLLDIYIESFDDTGGRILVSWEDSHWGNSYDMDGVSRIEWCIGDDTSGCPGTPPSLDLGSGYNWADFDWKTSGLSDDTIQVRISTPQATSANAFRFGYIINGIDEELSSRPLVTNTPTAAMNAVTTTNLSGQYIVRATLANGEMSYLLRQGGYDITRVNANSGNRIIYTEPAVFTADPDSTVPFLNSPLWYTAKYGSFIDIDGDGTPYYIGSAADTREWDTRDTAGNEGADGIPDNYFPITNPSQLGGSLSLVLDNLSESISSGTAAAVVTNSSSGLGAVYQAYYHPQYTDDNENTITWGGVLHSIFIDESGRFREDNGIKGRLEGTSTDYVVDIYYDESVIPSRTRFQRYTQQNDPDTGVAFLQPFGTPADLEEFGSIWNARDELSDITQANLAVQRTVAGGAYTENAGSKRYIFTWLDSISSGTTGVVDSAEVVDFTASTFNPAGNNNYRYLGISDSSIATDLVDYIRGVDKPARNWRSRLTDIPGDGTSTPAYWILGDIVNSSPIVVNPPGSRYNILYGDDTYDAFQQQYDRRRQMIYVGGNDGMIHAFNGGIWDSALSAFYTQQIDPDTGTYTLGQSHELGAEMWAYIPMNLLPHLQWLREVDYPHVFYADGAIQAYDVNIFTPDATHPGGWGTILVANMRLGGGDFALDLDNDAADDFTMRSAIVILDITDPEGPPELIAEITDPGMAFTTAEPALVKARVPDVSGSYSSPSINEWILVFGSGPTELDSVTSTQDAKVFAYDLVDRQMITIATGAQVPSSDPSGFFGDFLVVDANNDFVDDVVYAGTVEGTEAAPEGRVKRIELDSSSPAMGLSSSGGMAVMSDLIDINKPVTARPNVRNNVLNSELWVLFGTGRLFTAADNRSAIQQYFIGVKDSASAVSENALVDTTDLIVKTTGLVYDVDTGDSNPAALVYKDGSSVGTSVESFNELYAAMNSEAGWITALSYDGSSPAERVFTTSLVLGSSIIFTSYSPDFDLCTIQGDGALYAYNFRTGTAQYFGPFGSDENDIAYAGVDLGQGAPSAPTAIVRTGNEVTVDGTTNQADLSVVTGSTTGVTSSTGFSSASGGGGRMSWELLDIPF